MTGIVLIILKQILTTLMMFHSLLVGEVVGGRS